MDTPILRFCRQVCPGGPIIFGDCQVKSMITVSFHSTLKIELGCSKVQLDRADISVLQALRLSEQEIGRDFADSMVEASQSLHRPMILINGKNISLLQGFDSIIPAGGHLTVLPVAGGG